MFPLLLASSVLLVDPVRKSMSVLLLAEALASYKNVSPMEEPALASLSAPPSVSFFAHSTCHRDSLTQREGWSFSHCHSFRGIPQHLDDALGRLSPSRTQSLVFISDTSLQSPFPENLALIRNPLVYHKHFSIFHFQQKKITQSFFLN